MQSTPLSAVQSNSGFDSNSELHNEVMSQVAFQNKRLSETEKDAVLIDLAKSLLDEKLY
jgi:hypothetical protein